VEAVVILDMTPPSDRPQYRRGCEKLDLITHALRRIVGASWSRRETRSSSPPFRGERELARVLISNDGPEDCLENSLSRRLFIQFSSQNPSRPSCIQAYLWTCFYWRISLITTKV